MKQLLIILLLLCCATAFAQDKDEKTRVDFYGYVVTVDSLYPTRNTHVISKMAQRAARRAAVPPTGMSR